MTMTLFALLQQRTRVPIWTGRTRLTRRLKFTLLLWTGRTSHPSPGVYTPAMLYCLLYSVKYTDRMINDINNAFMLCY